MRNSNCTCDKRSYRMICNEYSAKLNKAKQFYHYELIDKCAGDSGKLFTVVSSLAEIHDENPLLPHNELAQLVNDFGEFSAEKFN